MYIVWQCLECQTKIPEEPIGIRVGECEECGGEKFKYEEVIIKGELKSIYD